METGYVGVKLPETNDRFPCLMYLMPLTARGGIKAVDNKLRKTQELLLVVLVARRRFRYLQLA